MRSRPFLMVAAAIVLSGCGQSGGPRLPLAGTVTFAGRPVPAGRIDFLPDTGRGGDGPAGFAAIRGGRFDTRDGGRGVVAGPYLAVVRGTDGIPGPAEGQEAGRPLFDPVDHPFMAASDVAVAIEITGSSPGR